MASNHASASAFGASTASAFGTASTQGASTQGASTHGASTQGASTHGAGTQSAGTASAFGTSTASAFGTSTASAFGAEGNDNSLRQKTPRHPCICIPCIGSDTHKLAIRNVFNTLAWGHIKDIVMLHKATTMCVFVYIEWFNTQLIDEIRHKFMDNKCIKVVCNEFTLWKLYAKK